MTIAAAAARDAANSNTTGTLKIGTVVEYDGRLWRVGLISESRARLDPLQGKTVTIAAGGTDSDSGESPRSAHKFESLGTSVNVSPMSILREINQGELDDAAARRLRQLNDKEKTMADAQTANAGGKAATAENGGAAKATVSAAPIPGTHRGRGKKGGKAKKNGRKSGGRGKKSGRAEVAKENLCMCGCGEKTNGYFVPGHDARFKGWLIKIERGEAKPEDLLKKAVRERFKWVKKGEGMIPTTDYKDESHDGYLRADGTRRKSKDSKE